MNISMNEMLKVLHNEDYRQILINLNSDSIGNSQIERRQNIIKKTGNDTKELILNLSREALIKVCKLYNIESDGTNGDMMFNLFNQVIPIKDKKKDDTFNPDMLRNKIKKEDRTEVLKIQLEEYYKEYAVIDYERRYNSKDDKTQIVLNKKIFEIEVKLHDLNNKYGVNMLLDGRIYSRNIMDSFDKDMDLSDYFRQVSYQVPALIFLTQKILKKEHSSRLINLTNEYFEHREVRDRLTFPDIKRV